MEMGVYSQFYELEQKHWWFRGMRHLCQTMINQYVEQDKNHLILDIGCGTGVLTKSLQNVGTVISADNFQEALDFCRKNNTKFLIKTSGENPSFKGNSFSLIVAFGLIEHLERDDLFLSEMYRVLKPGGNLMVLTSAFDFLWTSHDEIVHHKRRYMLSELKMKMQRLNFKEKKYTYVNFLLFHVLYFLNTAHFFLNKRKDLQRTPYIFKTFSPVNFILEKALFFENIILKYLNFPYGIGLLCIVQKEENAKVEALL